MTSFLLSIRKTVVGLGIALGLWAAIVIVFDAPHYILPGPERVFTALVSHAPFLLHHAGITALETVLGFAAGAAAGAFLAVLLWLSPLLARFAMPPILVSQALR